MVLKAQADVSLQPASPPPGPAHPAPHRTHVEDGDDGRVVSADDGGNVLGLGNLGGDQLEEEEEEASGGPVWGPE